MSWFQMGRSVAACFLALAAAYPAKGQVAENPKDPTGISIPHQRIRLVHSTDIAQEGTSGHLKSRDPFLFYQTGRDLLHRQFQLEHGIYGNPSSLSVPLYVGLPEGTPVHGRSARFAREHTSSCGMCHSSLYREPSAGQTIASTGGQGRNTSHFYGAGLVEMIGEQVRATILEAYDANGNGLIDREEVTEPRPVVIRPTPEAEPVDYGDLAPGPDGVPQLNCVFRVWYVDAEGEILPNVFSLADPTVAGYGFAMQPFGWGRGYRQIDDRQFCQGGEATTVREFYTVAADVHMGLQAFDPTQMPAGARSGPAGFGGLALRSLNGAQQYDFGGSIDRGRRRTPSGLSLDDPDRDGHLTELTEGDVDAIEFYLLHTPPPAVRGTARSERGREVFKRVGCDRCHVENWRLAGADEGQGPGDRRLFHLETRSQLDEHGVPQVVGRLVRLADVLDTGQHAPAGQPFLVERVYSDFKLWDIGPGYWERRFDGSLQREHRTAPLWGVGSTGPYGHGGQYMSLEDAVAAHGGAAQKERDAYVSLKPDERESLLEYLRSLVLYPTDEIPADIDGDGEIADDFEVAGQPVGYERFDARFLFGHPPRYRQVHRGVHHTGRVVPFLLIENVEEAYGLKLPFRVDSDGDGFPDVFEYPPKKEGVANVEENAQDAR